MAGEDGVGHALFPTRRRAIKGVAGTAVMVMMSAFLLVLGSWGYRVLGVAMLAMAIALGRQWLHGLRRTRPLMWISDHGLQLPSGQTLRWAEVEGIVVGHTNGLSLGVVAKDRAKVDGLPFARRLSQRIESANTGWPMWAALPLTLLSMDDRLIIDNTLAAHNVTQLAPKKGKKGRIIRAIVSILSP